MSQVSDEVLMAYADGELTPEETQALERLLRHDPILRARLAPFAETRDQLSSAFEHKLYEPVPDRLIAAIRRARPTARASAMDLSLGEKIRNLVAKAASTLAPGGFTPALAASMAALVVTGAAVGWIAGSASGSSSLIAASGPDLVATGALAQALEANPSGKASNADAANALVTPVLSFKTAGNAVCREYRVRTAEADRDFAGLACRSADGVWRVAQHLETPKQSSSPQEDYRTATGAPVVSIDAMVETMINGDAYGADDEAKLLANGWQISR